MASHFDVLVLGTGNAGMAAAGAARAAGKSVAMVESRDVGGTCPLRGCVPKKVLVAAAQVLDQIARAPAHHIQVAAPRLDWPGLIERKEEFIAGVPDDFKGSLEKRQITLIDGRARFTGPAEIAVGDTVYTADRIVIATGSVPRALPIPGWEHTITSDDILDMASQPDSVVFIGGGVIAMEFSHVFARAGTKVTILEALPRLLPRLEKDAVDVIHAETLRIGVDVVTDVKVVEIKQSGGAYTVVYEKDGARREATAAVVANGTGRVADVEGLGLDKGGIAHDGGRIAVTDHLRSTSNPHVYVAGDALWSTAQLSPIASYEGRIVGRNLIDEDSAVPDYTGMPSAVYTVPALASVGMTEEEATKAGLTFTAKSNDMTSWRSARTYAETASYAKVLVEDGSGKIIGAHMVGHGAEEVIHLFAFAIKYGVTAQEIGSSVFAYPTFTSDLKFLV
ncbi:MAG: NAD(P)/FAD-dependent oxidoreductase [Proteobacteria bacterium]|nr:NAD(P)/FAD-dependent oxidoreductase [Pseudomonadota bacterium]